MCKSCWEHRDLVLDACGNIFRARILPMPGGSTLAYWEAFGSERGAARIGEECRAGTACCCPEPHVPLRRATLHVLEEVGDVGA